jgi:CDP-glucose 4,6-dehydratase
MFIKVWGSGTYKCEQSLNSPHEAGLLKLDISKVTNELSWNPKLAAEETIKFTADWYRNFDNDRENISNFTLYQIQNYLGR